MRGPRASRRRARLECLVALVALAQCAGCLLAQQPLGTSPAHPFQGAHKPHQQLAQTSPSQHPNQQISQQLVHAKRARRAHHLKSSAALERDRLAVSLAGQQQPQQLQQHLQPENARPQPADNKQQHQQQATPQQTTAAKQSNHRLVSKLKDRRHRRRNRHQQYRNQRQQNKQKHAQAKNQKRTHFGSQRLKHVGAAGSSPSVAMKLAGPVALGALASAPSVMLAPAGGAGGAPGAPDSPVAMLAAASSNTLTALESMVDEVARAGQPNGTFVVAKTIAPVGQQPASSAAASSSSAAVLQQQQQQQQSPALSGSDLLLGGSQAPVSLLAGQEVPFKSSLQGARGPSHVGARGSLLTSVLSKVLNVLNKTEVALELRNGIASRASCLGCNTLVAAFMSPLYSKDVFSAALRTVCTSFRLQTPRVCAGLIESFQDDFEFIRSNTKLSRDEVCAVVFGVDCARRQTVNLFWTVPVPPRPGADPEPHAPAPESSVPHIGGLPMSEHALTNMDDAPDLFEYRKSAVPVAASGAAEPAKELPAGRQLAPQASAGGSVGPSVATTSHQAGGQNGAQPLLQAKASNGKRAEYIFDDEAQLALERKPEQAPPSAGSTALAAAGSAATSTKMAASASSSVSGAPNKAAGQQQQKLSTFVHITDIHIDPYYEAGALNDCGEPLCCRASSGPMPLHDKRRQAGRWGDYGNCDTPVRTLQSALQRIRDQHPGAEYWLWTGDISPHDIWNITKSEAASHVRLVTKLVREYSNGLPVFPVIGNHEAHPVNSFSPPEIKGKFSMSWLYDLLADEWSDWLPAEALKTLRIGGYYKLQVRKGFRIIALNTNYCARLNPWSFYNPIDPASQLKWLVKELYEAELQQDKVHIIGHVPPDNRECTQAWLFNFINIVDRFKDTISAQFYGHTHRDEFRIIYSLVRPEEPIGVQYIGPSLTPFTENNPAYRVYTQDKIGNLLHSDTYFFNLTEANESPQSEPNWQFAYNTRDHLNMSQGLTPEEQHQFLQRLHDDEEMFDSFFKNYYRSSDVKVEHVCRAKCKMQVLSDLRLSHPFKTKPKPLLNSNRKTSNHHRDRHAADRHQHYHHHHHHYHHHHHHHKRHRLSPDRD